MGDEQRDVPKHDASIAYAKYKQAFDAKDQHDIDIDKVIVGDKTKKKLVHYKAMFEGTMVIDVDVDENGNTNEETVIDAMCNEKDKTFIDGKETKFNFFLLKVDSESGLGYDDYDDIKGVE